MDTGTRCDRRGERGAKESEREGRCVAARWRRLSTSRLWLSFVGLATARSAFIRGERLECRRSNALPVRNAFSPVAGATNGD